MQMPGRLDPAAPAALLPGSQSRGPKCLRRRNEPGRRDADQTEETNAATNRNPPLRRFQNSARPYFQNAPGLRHQMSDTRTGHLAEWEYIWRDQTNPFGLPHYSSMNSSH